MNRGKKKRKKINISKLISVLMFVLLLTLGISIFLNSDIFNLKDVNISGISKLTEEGVMEDINIKYNKNIFTYNTKAIKKVLLKNSYVEDVSIKIKLPNKINISIKEVKPIAVLKNKENYCYISRSGVLLEKVKEIDKNMDKVVVNVDYDYDDEKIKFKNEEDEKRLFYLLDCLVDKNVYNQIGEIFLTKNESIKLITKNNIKTIVPNNENLDYNISRLNKILVDLKTKNKKNGTIDLTYGNYALYSP